MTVGERIKARRVEMGISQEELAKRVGVKGKSSVCKVETSGNDINTNTVIRYAEALHTTPAALMGWHVGESSAPLPTDGALDAELLHKFSKLTKEQKKAIMKFIDAFLND